MKLSSTIATLSALLLSGSVQATPGKKTALRGLQFETNEAEMDYDQVVVRGTDTYTAFISAAQEVPECMSSALGYAIATVQDHYFCIKLSYDGLSGPELSSHVHGPAAAGETGPVIFTMVTKTQKKQCFELTTDQRKDLDDDLWYFNIHSDMCPGGEIRGQILPAPAPPTGPTSIITQALGYENEVEVLVTDTYFALISAAQEVPGCMSSALGNAVATVQGDQFCIKLNYDGLSGPELSSHVHGPAAFGETGPVIFTLANSTQKTQCFELPSDEMKDLDDEMWYFNIHSADCPGGEIRGQILPTPAPSTETASIINEALEYENEPVRRADTYYALISAAQEVPECVSSAVGNAIVSVENDHFCIKLSYVGLSGPELSSHVHGPAAVGETGPVIFTMANSTQKTQCFELTPDQMKDLDDELWYFNIHSDMCPGGEIRGQILPL
jgi:hypothetical protein